MECERWSSALDKTTLRTQLVLMLVPAPGPERAPLVRPRHRKINETFGPETAWQASFDCGLDDVEGEESKRQGHPDRTHSPALPRSKRLQSQASRQAVVADGFVSRPVIRRRSGSIRAPNLSAGTSISGPTLSEGALADRFAIITYSKGGFGSSFEGLCRCRGWALSREPELATRSPEVPAGLMLPSQLATSGTLCL
jgi:hypothetical protein